MTLRKVALNAGQVKVLSLGAGVQSSALALMYENGVLPDPLLSGWWLRGSE